MKEQSLALLHPLLHTLSNSTEPGMQYGLYTQRVNELAAQRDSQENLITHFPSVP